MDTWMNGKRCYGLQRMINGEWTHDGWMGKQMQEILPLRRRVRHEQQVGHEQQESERVQRQLHQKKYIA